MNAFSMSTFTPTELTLAEVGLYKTFVVRDVVAPAASPEWRRYLEDLGFTKGELVEVKARGPFGGDPISVRVGLSTFALRLAEARCIHLATTPELNRQNREARA